MNNIWILETEDVDNDNKSMFFYENETDALMDAAFKASVNFQCYLTENEEYDSVGTLIITAAYKKICDSFEQFEDKVQTNHYKEAIEIYDKYVSSLVYDKFIISVYSTPLIKATIHPSIAIRTTNIKEKPCKICGKMNDIGVSACWCCGNSPH